MSLTPNEVLRLDTVFKSGEPPIDLIDYRAPGPSPLSYPPHAHEFSELVITTAGRGRHLIGARTYELEAGDVFVIPPGIGHEFIALESARYWTVVFLMSAFGAERASIEALPGYRALFVLEPSVRRRRRLDYRFHLDADRLDMVSQLLTRMEQEKRLRATGYRVMLVTLFRELIVTLARSYDEQDHAQTRQFLRVSRAISFIETHYTEPIDLARLCRAAAVSKPTLNRYFHEVTDLAPLQYLMRYRMHKAADLLRKTDQSVTEIAFAVGFNDGNYFSATFSRHMGCPPSTYRQTAEKRMPHKIARHGETPVAG